MPWMALIRECRGHHDNIRILRGLARRAFVEIAREGAGTECAFMLRSAAVKVKP